MLKRGRAMYCVFGTAGCSTGSHPVYILPLEPLTHRASHRLQAAIKYK